MKKKFFLLIPIFFFLFLPKDAFALTINGLEPYRSEWWNRDNDLYENFEFTVEKIYNYDYYTFQNSNTTNRVRYSYNVPDEFKNKNNDYSFIIWQPNISLGTVNNYSSDNNKPIVFVNGIVCDVYSTSSYSTNGVVWSSAFGVNCSNVTMNEDTFAVNILTPSLKYDNGLFNDKYGISYIWAYTPHIDNSSTNEILKSQLEESQKQTEETKKQTEEIKKNTETIKDSDTTESQEQASGFFDDFESDDYGLSDIITMPLTFIKGLSSSTCYSLNLPLPFVDTNATLPCMTSIYSKYFGSFLTLYQTITTGIIAYWCCINIFRMVQGFKNPDSDEIEVMDL